MNGPDYLTQEEERELDKIVDLQVQDSIEQKHLYEIQQDAEEDTTSNFE